MRAIALILLLASCLAGCAQRTAVGYGAPEPVGEPTEQRLDDSRYRVSFQGTAEMPRDAVEAAALRRAAELTRTAGEGRFALLDRVIERQVRVDPVAVRIRDFDLSPCSGRGRGFPERTLVLNQDNFTYREMVTYAATLVVQPFTGEPPDDTFKVYDAGRILTGAASGSRLSGVGHG